MKRLFIFIFSCHFLIFHANTVTVIHDLEAEDYSGFNKELAEWTPQGLLPLAIDSTSSKTFLGFFSTYPYTQVQRTYSGIDEHEFITFSFSILLYGSYSGQIFQIEFDGIPMAPLMANAFYKLPGVAIEMKGGVVHSGSTLQVKIVNRVTSDLLLWGFGDLTMNFYKTSEGYSNGLCQASLEFSQLSPMCGCGVDQKEAVSGCKACSTGCAYCWNNNNREVCSQCDLDNFYDWSGEKCESVCESYCNKCPGLVGESCSSCLGEHSLYGNGACVDSCPAPLVEVAPATGKKMKTCSSLCGVSQWIYPDKLCYDSCEDPLVPYEDEGGVMWCKSPCESPNEYLYPNGVCGGECSGIFVKNILQRITYCENSCFVDDKYIFRNESCMESCLLPNKKVNDKLGKTCKSPCEDPADYYYTEKGVCESTCEYPNEKNENGPTKLCRIGLDSDQIEQTKQVSKAVNGIDSGATGAITVLSFLSSSDSSSILVKAFTKMLQYIKYMDIAYPAKVQLMLENLNSNTSSGGFASRMMRKELDKFPKRRLPEKFEYYGAVSSFFVNYWPSLFILLILLSVTGLVILLRFCLKPPSKVNGILNQIIGHLKWNIVLLLFCGDFGDIVFFTALELSTEKVNSFQSAFSLVICIMMNIFALWVLTKILTVNFNIKKSKQVEKWQNYKTFFAIYKDESYFQQIFMFVFIIRVSIFNAVIGYSFNYPLLQAILITCVNLSMLLYLIFKRPMKMLINFIQQLVLEGFLLAFNICICILAVLDSRGVQAYDFRNNIGEAMLVINIIVPIVSMILLSVKFVIIGVEAYRDWKAEKAKKKRNIRVELPRKLVNQGVEKNVEMEAEKSNNFDISSSNLSFVNNSDAWINIQANERNQRLRSPRFKNAQVTHSGSDIVNLEESTGYQVNNREFPEMESPVRRIFKKPRIKRKKPLDSNDDEAKSREVEAVAKEENFGDEEKPSG